MDTKEIIDEAKRLGELVVDLTADEGKGIIATTYFMQGAEFSQKWTPISEGLPRRYSLVNVKLKQNPEIRSVATMAAAWFDCENDKQLWHICGTDIYLSESPTHWKYLR